MNELVYIKEHVRVQVRRAFPLDESIPNLKLCRWWDKCVDCSMTGHVWCPDCSSKWVST